MNTTSASVILAALCGLSVTGLSETADTIYHGGPIITIHDAAPRAEAVAVRAGKILAVGKKDDVFKTRGANTRLVDLAGRTLLPGFVDAHGHVMGGGIQALSANLLPPPDGEGRDIASLQRVLREWVAANDAAVKQIGFIIGFGYDNSQIKERRHPTRDDLDAISKELPVLLVHQSGHIVAVNTKALEKGGITAATPNPDGGVIRRRAGGQEPDGVLEETAAFPLIFKLLGGVGAEGGKAFVKAGAEVWARYGYTTGQEGRATPGTVKLFQAIAAEGGLKIDVAAYPDVLMDREIIKSNVSRDYRNRFRVAGAKLTIDGSVQGFTAWRDRPYYKITGNYPPGYVGYAAAKPEQVGGAIDWAYANKIQIITHANGEAAMDQLIAFLGASAAKHGAGDRRPVLIHGQLLREDQVDSCKQIGLIPSLFPMHTFYWGDLHRDETVGPRLVDNISPTGWCVKRGIKFTSHHDAPVAFPDSMRVLDATVTRRSRSGDIIGPDQRVDVLTALKAMTLWPAWQHFEEETKGSIEVGKLADLVILDQDPTAIDPETLDTIKVAETIKEGVTVFNLTDPKSKPADASHRSSNGSELAFTRAVGAAFGPAGHEPGPACLCGALTRLVDVVVTGGRNGHDARGY
jgi:predicted amidohydrolase YtcJ